MNASRTPLLLVGTLVLTGVSQPGLLAGDYNLNSAARVSPGYINDLLRADNPYASQWNVGVNYRVRYEIHENGNLPPLSARDFSAAPGVDNDNSYLLQRVKARVGYTAEWFEVFGEARSSSSTGDDRNPNPESDGPVDLHQAYVYLGNHKEFPLSLKVGRQELSYGDERVIGAFAWNNIGRVFDAAKLRWQNAWFGADFFTSRLVLPDDNQFNVSNDYDYFSGVYATTKKVPKVTMDAYFLARNASASAATSQPTSLFPMPSARDIYTLGVRLKSTPEDWGNWDFTGEYMGQFGHYNDPRLIAASLNPSLSHEAFALYSGVGYTWKESSVTPRVGLEYNFASGDSNPRDDRHETFENLFPTNHKFYGFMDFASLQNLHNVRLQTSIKPVARINLAAEGHLFWLADTSDNFYTVGGAPRGGIGATPGNGYGINTGYSSFVGSEIDLVATYTVNSYIQVEAMYGHFFRGNFVKNTFAAVGSQDADFVYLQTVFHF